VKGLHAAQELPLCADPAIRAALAFSLGGGSPSVLSFAGPGIAHADPDAHMATAGRVSTSTLLPEDAMAELPPLVVFSHLRWNFVFQRPQQLLTRLAQRRRVLFIEEPLEHQNGSEQWSTQLHGKNLLVCQPRLGTMPAGFSDEALAALAHLVPALLEREGVVDYVAWFYTPMAVPLLPSLRPRAVIYDCMDELAAFDGAPPELLERERGLLERADLVFTGGRSLFEAKRGRNPHVHCFPSSVDAAHFGAGREPANEAPEQRPLPGPRLGYFGVIDERIDLAMLDALAAARPDWQLVMVGPTAKIDAASLPRRPNIHYFGQRAYADLPSFLAGWDVCLLPFARNKATRFISPTKTLEYMAAERMIVSTPIQDVAEPYGEIVLLANDATEFIAACERALSLAPEERAARVERMRGVLARTSWDKTAAAMDELIGLRAGDGPLPLHLDASHGGASQGKGAGKRPPVVIIGAGPTGLSAAYHIGSDALLLEQADRVGGWCRSIEWNGFTFDFAGHIMFSNERYVHELYKILLGDNVHWQDREAWIYSHGVHTRYPFQGSLYGLPPEVIKECVVGVIEARFGKLKPEAAKPAPIAKAVRCPPRAGEPRISVITDCCADGVLESTAPLARTKQAEGVGAAASAPPANFEEFIYKVWGEGIAKHFAIPYNQKLWAVPLDEMETSWLGGRVPMPDLEEMIEYSLRPVPKPMGPNARFGYPLKGGFQALMDGFLPHLTGPVRTGARVQSVSPHKRTVTLADGTTYGYKQLISTMPLPSLIKAMGDEAPAEIRALATRLRYLSVRCVHLGIGREKITNKHWIYYPGDEVFHRIFVQGNASPSCNPPGGFGITCEITYAPQKPLPCEGEELIQRCIDDCRRVGIIREDDEVTAAVQVDLPHAYVIYDHARAEVVARIRSWLGAQDIILAGRYSEWEYYNSDHAFIAGKKAADEVARRAEVRNHELPHAQAS